MELVRQLVLGHKKEFPLQPPPALGQSPVLVLPLLRWRQMELESYWAALSEADWPGTVRLVLVDGAVAGIVVSPGRVIWFVAVTVDGTLRLALEPGLEVVAGIVARMGL